MHFMAEKRLRKRSGLKPGFGDNSANFSRVKKYNDEFRGVYILTIREKTLNVISCA